MRAMISANPTQKPVCLMFNNSIFEDTMDSRTKVASKIEYKETRSVINNRENKLFSSVPVPVS